MRIELNLTKHCVETEIKRVYHHALSAYFRTGVDQRHLEQIIGLTQKALERLDFSFLRSQYPPLAGNSGVPVVLAWRGEQPVILIAEQAIPNAEKKASTPR